MYVRGFAMGRPSWTFEQELEEYLQELREMGRSERTIHDYEWSVRDSFKGLGEAGMTLNPRKVTQNEIECLLNGYYNGSVRYKAYRVKVLRLFLKWAGNPNVAKIRTNYMDNNLVRNIRWLTDEQARMVRESAVGIERILVHCELDLGMRRIEVIRLKVQDFKPGRRNIILIHGKGMNGGKWRQINWHPETSIILRAWLEQREAIVRKAREKNPDAIDPGNLLIYENNGTIGGYRKTAIDNVLANLGERLGFHVSNHDLRRTCGRMMFRAEVPIEVIAKILGHSDIRTTLHYLGLDYEDMSSAFLKYSEYQRNAIVPQMVQNELSQEIGGPNGI